MTPKSKADLHLAPKRLVPIGAKTSFSLDYATPLVPNPTHLFSRTEDSRYFKVFCDTTGPHLAEYLDSHLWNYIVLQASEQETFTRHAVIALGALNKAWEDCLSKKTVPDGAQHYEAAFREYGKSIQGIWKACAEYHYNRRTILIACLLATCFEYLYGNVALALSHVKNGITLNMH